MISAKRAIEIFSLPEDERNKKIDSLSEEEAKYLLKIAFKTLHKNETTFEMS